MDSSLFLALVSMSLVSTAVAAPIEFSERVEQLWEQYPIDKARLAFHASSEKAFLSGSEVVDISASSGISAAGLVVVRAAADAEIPALEASMTERDRQVIFACGQSFASESSRAISIDSAYRVVERFALRRYDAVLAALSDSDAAIWLDKVLPFYSGSTPFVGPRMRSEIMEALSLEFPSVMAPFSDKFCDRFAGRSAGRYRLVRDSDFGGDGHTVSESMHFERVE